MVRPWLCVLLSWIFRGSHQFTRAKPPWHLPLSTSSTLSDRTTSPCHKQYTVGSGSHHQPLPQAVHGRVGLTPPAVPCQPCKCAAMPGIVLPFNYTDQSPRVAGTFVPLVLHPSPLRVTPYNPEQRFPAGDFVLNEKSCHGLSQWTKEVSLCATHWLLK